ncbi:MAG: NUDIX domain-containing protein [Chloroflexi bacterium]|nr:NUDIX domain-containing protein [Chloroflexota bacterium]
MQLREYRAAGGIVVDDAGRALLIERLVMRNGQIGLEVRLPKGHVEPGETDEEAALREVCEETGYCGLAVTADLGEYLNEFNWPDQQARVLRHEHYYLMRLTDPVRGKPQFDNPDAEEARFLPRWAANLAEAERVLTFESEKEFVRRAQGGNPQSAIRNLQSP